MSPPFVHSRPADTRVLTTNLPLVEFFALCDAAKTRGVSRVDLASRLLILAMRGAGILDVPTATAPVGL